MEQGFLSALFDTSFRTLITNKIVRVLFILAIIFSGLWALVTLYTGMQVGGTTAFIALITAVIGFFGVVIGARVYLEVVLVLFRIAENTNRTAELLAGMEQYGLRGDGPSTPSPPSN